MQQILHQLRSGGDTSFTSIDDVVPWLERSRRGKSWQEVLEYYETLPEPRIFKTHCTAEQTPGLGTVKVILTSRDPRDCCVSFYHHIMNMTESAREQANISLPRSLAEHVERWLENAVWYRNVKSWWPYYSDERVLWLRYQDMKEDLAESVMQITRFLSWTITEETLEKVIEYSSFAWMKSHDEKFSNQVDGKRSTFKPGKFIRQGKVGSHKEMLSAAQEKSILDKARQELEPECLHFLELTE